MKKQMPSKRSYSNRIRHDSTQEVLMHANNFTLDYAQLNEYSAQSLITKETKDDRENKNIVTLPLNSGHNCPKAPMGPLPVYCPIDNSINSNGMLQTIKIMQYGTKKTPGKVSSLRFNDKN
uniref:Uncharacterized protein n=1 Tax=Glossina austeni TaxID=7395 RepID=A0A1A9VW38_GLOAU